MSVAAYSMSPTLNASALRTALSWRGWEVRSVFAGDAAVWLSVVSISGVRCTVCVTTYSARMAVRGKPETGRAIPRRVGPIRRDEDTTIAELTERFALANPRAA